MHLYYVDYIVYP